MKITAISDTHEKHNYIDSIEETDVLIHAGDVTGNGSTRKLNLFLDWIETQEYEDCIIIAGNHDYCFEDDDTIARNMLEGRDIHYLFDDRITINGLKFYGTPWQPYFCNWAFNIRSEEKLAKKYSKIPDDTDILITHTPPYKILDKSIHGNEHTGSEALREKVFDVQPKVHIFGHIHEEYGKAQVNGIKFINASSLGENYQVVNDPMVFHID